MEKKFRVTHQFNYSVDNLISKANKHVALRLRLDSMALRMLMSATVLSAFISEILQTALNVKGLPHLHVPVSFHIRLQVYI